MLPSKLRDVDPTVVERLVGSAAYRRGQDYARRGRVTELEWDADDVALLAWVDGTYEDEYSTTVYFHTDRLPLEFEQGQCSCPVGLNCKHVAAVVLAAINDIGAAGPAGRRSGRTAALDQAKPQVTAVQRVPGWEQAFDTLLADAADHPGAGNTAAGPGRVAGPIPLGIELSLGESGELLARLVQPGRAGRWVANSLAWGRLQISYDFAEYEPEHVRVLRELYALHTAGGVQRAYGSGQTYYSYSSTFSTHGYGQTKLIDLGRFESRQLWPLLDEAVRAGVTLVRGPERSGALERPGTARLCLDVTRDPTTDDLVVRPMLDVTRVGDRPVGSPTPVGFIGTIGHGLIYFSADPGGSAGPGSRASGRGADADSPERTWQLARLDKPVGDQMQAIVLQDRSFVVPIGDQERFATDFAPRLQRLAPLISSDGSFTPPTVSEPTLVMRASYEGGHEVDLGWEWRYLIGDREVRTPLGQVDDDPGHRDLDAERELLDGLGGSLEGAGLVGPSGAVGPPLPGDAGGPGAAGLVRLGDAAPATSDPAEVSGGRLHGLDTMMFTTEVLPRLKQVDRLEVEVDGEPADYRPVDDRVRIGVSAQDKDDNPDWFDLGITISVDGRKAPFTKVFSALSRGEPYLLMDDGGYFSLDHPDLQALRRLIDEARALQDHQGDSLTISRYQVGLWDELARLGVVDSQSEVWQRQVQTLMSIESLETPEPPEGLEAQLRPYQLDGFGWLAFCWQAGLGGILADDMGLGKTVQTLALICHAKRVGGRFLVVAPTSVLSTWVSETERFAPGLKVATITDTARRRGHSLADAIDGADIVVTTYTLFRLEIDEYIEAEWAGLILDEAQNVKNHQSKIYQCARRLPAPFKLAITGTPMENNLMELWSLLSITAPGLFPNPNKFKDYYARPVEKGDSDLLGQLRRRIRPLMMRRTKEQVVTDLPGKQEQVLELDLHPRHRTIYQRRLQRERQRVLGLLDDMDRNRFTILQSLTTLRQLSLHAGLVDAGDAAVSSAKLDALTEHLHDAIGGGHRVLVFSQFTRFLGMVRDRLDAEGVGYAYLDGKTRDRAKVIERFKKGEASVFLISLKAGGFGLNLTEADYCFVLDPWWNPATEAQAIDRAHRIGQTRTVMVYRLIAKDTIEEKVMAMKARKAELFSNVMDDDGNAFSEAISADDIRGLFT